MGVQRALTSFDAMLASGEVDAVTIASPIGLHFAQGRQAIEAGVHVHFNKTMTTGVDPVAWFTVSVGEPRNRVNSKTTYDLPLLGHSWHRSYNSCSALASTRSTPSIHLWSLPYETAALVAHLVATIPARKCSSGGTAL